MKNLNVLETFRTKEELKNYFEEKGQTITEEEIVNLKKSYEQAGEANGTLSLQQLDNVAGGIVFAAAHNRKIYEEKANAVVDLYNRSVEVGQQVKLIKDEKGLYTFEFRINPEQLSNNEYAKALHGDLEKMKKEYLDNKPIAIAEDIAFGISFYLLVGGFVAMVILKVTEDDKADK